MSDDKTKQEYIGNFIRALAEVEAEMLPYQEHRKDLKKSYVQNGWLSKDDMRQAVRAYRMMSKGDSIDQFVDLFDTLAKGVTGAGTSE
jgi:hypothetical protein